MLLPIPVEPRLAQAGAGRDHRRLPGGIRGTLVERDKILWSQHGDAVGVGLQVIEQADRAAGQRLRQLPGIDGPGQVDRFGTSVSRWSGHPEAGDVDRQVMR
jgi:hypothetical protein